MARYIFFFAVLIISCKNEEICEENFDGGCICTKDYNPVCGCNQITYGNSCMAECSGIANFTIGECQ